MSGQRASNVSRRVLAAAFASGAAAIVYQVVWVRILSVSWGSTASAACLVLSAFMAGMAAGGWLLGRRADTAAEPLRAYAALEGTLAGAALLVTWLLGRAGAALSLAAVLPAAALIGGTMPLLAGHLRAAGGAAAGFPALYFWNALGGGAAALAADFLLVPAWGLWRTAAVAAGLNLAAAAAAWTSPATAPSAEVGSDADGAAPVPRWLALAAAASGLAALAHEFVWTRLVALVIGSSVYGFSLVLAVVLLGVALGGRLAGAIAASPRRVGWMGAALLASGVFAALPARYFEELPQLYLQLMAVLGRGWWATAAIQLAVAAAALLPAWVLLGAAFPTLVALAGLDRRVGEGAGLAYALNGLGAALGPWLAVFVLVPLLGLPGAAWACALLLAALGAGVLLLAETAAVRRAAPWALAACAGAVVLPPRVPAAALQSGVYIYGAYFTAGGSARKGWRSYLAASDVLFDETGREASVQVRRQPAGERVLVINGKADASDHGDAPTELALGHLPFVARPGSARAEEAVLVIGLGSGMTAAAAARHGVGRVDVIEVEPAVARAASYFEEANGRVLQDPRVHLAVGDAREALRRTERRYGVIVSEPSNPWIAAMSHLYTREFFGLLKSRLAPEGVLCQWLHAYSMTPRALGTALDTVRASFGHVQVWYVGMDLLVLASDQALPLDWDRVASRLAETGTAADMARAGFGTPEEFLARRVADERGVAALAARTGAALNTDDRPLLSYIAPLALHDQAAAAAAMSLLEASGGGAPSAAGGGPDAPRRLARALLAVGRVEAARAVAAGLPASDPARDGLQREVGRQLLSHGRAREAEAVFLARGEARPADPAVLLDVARAKLESGDREGALAALERFASLTGDGNPRAAAAVAAARRSRRPALMYLAAAYGYAGLRQGHAAAEAYSRVLQLDPGLLDGFDADGRTKTTR